MSENLPTIYTRDLIKEIAMDIGKEVVHYISHMYPGAIENTSSTFKLSVRNCIFNEIMASLKVNEEGQITARLQNRKKFRRLMNKYYNKKPKSMEEIDRLRKEGDEIFADALKRGGF